MSFWKSWKDVLIVSSYFLLNLSPFIINMHRFHEVRLRNRCHVTSHFSPDTFWRFVGARVVPVFLVFWFFCFCFLFLVLFCFDSMFVFVSLFFFIDVFFLFFLFGFNYYSFFAKLLFFVCLFVCCLLVCVWFFFALFYLYLFVVFWKQIIKQWTFQTI